jgi:membrane protein DedA with SNARE-associated domain
VPEIVHLDLSGWITAYGPWAVFVLVGLESMGVPLPGETALVAAAVYAGTGHDLNILEVILAAMAGAIIGDNIGYEIGRAIGFPLLVRFGPRISLDEPRLKLGQYLFSRYGGGIVFFGRFVALLRTLAALLAGANRMPWLRFFVFNAAGGAVWSATFGLGGYWLGTSIHRIAVPVGIGLFILAVTGAAFGFAFLKRHEQSFLRDAERAFPGPLGDGVAGKRSSHENSS